MQRYPAVLVAFDVYEVDVSSPPHISKHPLEPSYHRHIYWGETAQERLDLNVYTGQTMAQ